MRHVKISFFGDFVSLTPNQLNIGCKLQNSIQSTDFNIVNFEAPIITDIAIPIHKSGLNIQQSHDAPKWLENNGFNVVSLANNHMLDFGITEAEATQQAFQSAKTMGIGSTDSAYQSQILEKNGFKIAIIALTHREFSCVDDYGYGCAWMCSPKVQQEITAIRTSVDYLFVLNHGGLEYFNQPLPAFRDLYRYWIDLGADAVVASHPHVPQGWDIYNGKPIFYSLGNLCFEKADGIFPNMWNNSLMVTFCLSKDSLSFNVNDICYNHKNKMIEIDTNQDISQHIQALNTTLRNTELYETSIQEHMRHIVPLYEYMLSVGKYTKIGFNKSFLKSIARATLHRQTDSLHHLNLYRCETHRWVMEYLLSHNLL